VAQDLVVAAASETDLNKLFGAALEFGSNWRRPVGELAAEHLPDQPRDDREAFAALVEDCESAIEAHVEAMHLRVGGAWTRAEEQRADAWIAAHFPWMTQANRRRALSQGQYYAWHDRG
jgi:hypothetical protein